MNKRINKKKLELANRLMRRDYCFVSTHSNMFIMMTRGEEQQWEINTTNEYYNKYSTKQMEEMLSKNC